MAGARLPDVVVNDYLNAYQAANPWKPLPSVTIGRGWFYVDGDSYRKADLVRMAEALRQRVQRRASSPRIMVEVEPDRFKAGCGYSAQRESGLTPNGNPIAGRWLLRDQNGSFLDVDQFRHDLFERNQLKPDY